MTMHWQPYREPLRTTLMRTGTIAIAVGVLIAWRTGNISRWPIAVILALWPSFGGHWVELWFLNWLRPRLPITRTSQIAARLVTWHVGGSLLAIGVGLTALALTNARATQFPAWWLAGLGFIGIELVVHLVLHLTGRPSFYNGRG